MKKFYNTRDSYIVYKNMSANPINISQYVQIINHFMKFLSSKLLSTGEIILPERLGRLSIFGKKVNIRIENGEIKGLAPDWVKTKQLWDSDEVAKNNKQLVYHFNEETNGIRYKFSWSKNRVLVSNKTLYNLRMTRSNKRELSRLVREGKEYLIGAYRRADVENFNYYYKSSVLLINNELIRRQMKPRSFITTLLYLL